MSLQCARCDWRGDDDAAEEHARETGHWRCIVCQRRFLTEFEPQTCASCVGRVRADLADIVTAAAGIDPTGVHSLTLLGDGTMQRHQHGYERIPPTRHPLARDDENAPPPIRDEWQSDPLPVLPALASWEDMLRQDCGDGKGSVPATLTETVDYLSRNLDTGREFAQTFHAFDELAFEIRRHRSAMQHAAGLADVPLRAGTGCLDCQGDLVRVYRDPAPPNEYRQLQQDLRVYLAQVDRDLWAARRGCRPVGPLANERGVADRMLREPRRGQDREGLTEEWECRDCLRVYTQAEYYLAVRAELESRSA